MKILQHFQFMKLMSPLANANATHGAFQQNWASQQDFLEFVDFILFLKVLFKYPSFSWEVVQKLYIRTHGRRASSRWISVLLLTLIVFVPGVIQHLVMIMRCFWAQALNRWSSLDVRSTGVCPSQRSFFRWFLCTSRSKFPAPACNTSLRYLMHLLTNNQLEPLEVLQLLLKICGPKVCTQYWSDQGICIRFMLLFEFYFFYFAGIEKEFVVS